MQYFSLNGELAHLAGKKVQEYFKKAIFTPGKPDSQINVHREYVREVITLFADRTELTFAQACQLAREANFEPFAQNMHRKRVTAIPAEIMTPDGKKPNPYRQKIADLADLPSAGHSEFMRQGWLWATSLMHPHSKPVHRGSSEMSREQEQKIAKQIFKHIDETREAHLKRAAEALTRAINDPTFLQRASDRLLQKTEESMSMKLRAAE